MNRFIHGPHIILHSRRLNHSCQSFILRSCLFWAQQTIFCWQCWHNIKMLAFWYQATASICNIYALICYMGQGKSYCKQLIVIFCFISLLKREVVKVMKYVKKIRILLNLEWWYAWFMNLLTHVTNRRLDIFPTFYYDSFVFLSVPTFSPKMPRHLPL